MRNSHISSHLNRIDRQQIALEASDNAADVTVQSLAEGIAQPGSAILCAEDDVDGGFTASALGFGIRTEAETIEALRANIREAVDCYFDETADAPKIIRLHFVRDEVLAR